MLMTLRARAVFKNIGRIFLLFLLLLIFVVSFLVGVCWVVFKGPSPAARDLLVVSAMETSAAKFVPRIFFSEEEIQDIIDYYLNMDNGKYVPYCGAIADIWKRQGINN